MIVWTIAFWISCGLGLLAFIVLVSKVIHEKGEPLLEFLHDWMINNSDLLAKIRWASVVIILAILVAHFFSNPN